MGKGKQIIKQAAELGLNNLPLTNLYGQPRKIKMMFSKNVPDYVSIIRDYLTLQDPEFEMKIHRGGRTRKDFFISVKESLYIETLGKMSGILGVDPSNHLFQISFYTKNEEHIRQIVKSIDEQFSDVGGILAHINWEKIKKVYKVEKEDCLAIWNKYL